MKNLGRLGLAGALLLALTAFVEQSGVKAAGGPQETASGSYRVLAPIESGNLLLFPVVRAGGKSGVPGDMSSSLGWKSPGATPFLHLGRRHQERRGGSDRGWPGAGTGAAQGNGRRSTLPGRPFSRSSGTGCESLSRRRGEHAGAGEPLRQASTAAGGRDRYRRQAGPGDRQGPHCAGRRRSY